MRKAAVKFILFCTALCLGGCQRTVDPREVLKQEARGKPINQLVKTGRAEMLQDTILLLPVVYATINDDIDCRLVVDTGAGDGLLLNRIIAEEARIKPVAEMGVSGIGGESASSLSLVREVSVGTIKVLRVMTFVVDDSVPLARFADGIIGTGVFADGRVTLDFEHAELVVAQSSDEQGRGTETAVRIAERKHIFAPLRVQGRPAVALLDSGATHPMFSPRWMSRNYPDHPDMDLSLPLPRFVAGIDTVAPGATTCVDLELAGCVLKDVGGVVMPDIDTLPEAIFGERADLLLGMTMLRELRSWTVDFPRQRMWMTWLGEPAAAESAP